MTATSLVVDASVALKWYLEDETDRDAALLILNAWKDSRLDIAVPSFWRLEVANGLRQAAARVARHLTPAKGRQCLADFLGMGPTIVDVTGDLVVIYDDALRLGATIYDVSYVHVAERFGIELVTTDDRLLAAVKASKPFVKHLRDYRLPPATPAPGA